VLDEDLEHLLLRVVEDRCSRDAGDRHHPS
jgi:hypothetical protein